MVETVGMEVSGEMEIIKLNYQRLTGNFNILASDLTEGGNLYKF